MIVGFGRPRVDGFERGGLVVDLGLTGAQESAIRRAVLAGDYNLLLGAGASLESIDTAGVPLPTGMQLAKLIADEFDVPMEEGDLLWRVYSRAIESVGRSDVYKWLRQKFWGVKPPNWMDLLARAPWSTVWTLNIDDSFEQAYSRVATDLSRIIRVINWDDDFKQSHDLQVVHLHGCVDRNTPRKLIFSLSEYTQAGTSRAAWPLNFRDMYGVSPFVIIGARLRDEPDIEAVVANRTPRQDAPSLYVNPWISSAAERDMVSWGLIPIRMTAEQFAEAWSELIKIDLSRPPSRQDELALRVGRQFRELNENQAGAPASHDFIGGDAPRWGDVVNDRHADLQWIQSIRNDCRALGKHGVAASSAIIYVGDRLTGRSVGLLAAGKELRRLSWRVFLFDDDERIDVEAILSFAASGRAVALLFDTIADVADDVAEILVRARGMNLSVCCVAVDGIEKVANILSRLSDVYLVHHRVATISSKLSRIDATRLVDKLNDMTRLGVLEGKKDSVRIAHFRNREIFDGMAQLENAPGFGRRITSLVKSLRSEQDLRILLLASFAARLSRRLLIIDVARALDVDSDRIEGIVQGNGNLAATVRIDGRWLVAKNRWMALDPSIEKIGAKNALDFLAAALSRMGPRLSRASQRERNATSMLVGSVMVYHNLAEVFPGLDLEPWYESLASTFGSWSSRYWEQRAIMCRTLGRQRPEILARAESFALRGVNIVRDAYSLTTLGTVLLTKAELGSEEEIVPYYDRAFDAFDAASEEDPANLVTWLAFLRYSLRVLERVVNHEAVFDADVVERLRDDWHRIHASIAVVAGNNDSVKRELLGLQRRYKSLM
ncbi:SIR2 family protein [Amycolatopsis sp. CA-128772]|uniref:SIR2 family protein n=1 Tax=Amycolatopsis sp. CA-128772 TaxID=2073159 RepID=UPI000CD1B409|nr:SIR2 family protein [Amycolatopsis sp. CA-128772]